MVAHSVTLEPSISCMETAHLRGYIDSSENIVCAHERCVEEVRGPTLCSVRGRQQGRHSVMSRQIRGQSMSHEFKIWVDE